MFNQVKSFLCDYKNIDAGTITMLSSLSLDLGFTSYDIIEMCAHLEELLHIEISDEILSSMTSVGDLVFYLEGAM